MSKRSVYVETTVVSYLTAWPSRDLVRAAQQQTTREWWDAQRHHFDLYTSELVLIECAAGDATASAERLAALTGIPVLTVSDAATAIADALLAQRAIPAAASRDALHVGISAANGVDFLLTWNFRHLANAAMRDKIEEACEGRGIARRSSAPPTPCSRSRPHEAGRFGRTGTRRRSGVRGLFQGRLESPARRPAPPQRSGRPIAGRTPAQAPETSPSRANSGMTSAAGAR
jgi:hypothetical protein